MRALDMCRLPLIGLGIILVLYLAFVSRNHFALAIALIVVVLLIIWHLSARKACRLPGPGPDDKPAPK